VWQAGAGITYNRIEQKGLQWPCFGEDHPGTETLHVDDFDKGRRTELRRIKYRPTPEVISEQFPFLLTTGRSLYQFNAGTMTSRTANTELRPADLLLMNFSDAEKLLLKNGEFVRVVSHYGESILPLQTDTTLNKGELFATFHTPQTFLNRVTSSNHDRYVYSPEYKVTAVRIEKLDSKST
jgi:formate dehydrogenase major subunit